MPHTAGQGGYIAARVRVCAWALLIVIANAILIGNRLLLCLNEKVGSDGRNWDLGLRTVFLEPVTSVSNQCPCNCHTIMYCHHWRPREANVFRILPTASVGGSIII
jgi:hypothetical protein